MLTNSLKIKTKHGDSTKVLSFSLSTQISRFIHDPNSCSQQLLSLLQNLFIHLKSQSQQNVSSFSFSFFLSKRLSFLRYGMPLCQRFTPCDVPRTRHSINIVAEPSFLNTMNQCGFWSRSSVSANHMCLWK